MQSKKTEIKINPKRKARKLIKNKKLLLLRADVVEKKALDLINKILGEKK